MKKTIAFAGSNSRNSINHKLVQYAATLKEGTDIIDLKNYSDVPIYNFDDEKESGIPAKVMELYNIFKPYENVILASPEHNGMPPAFLKNILDWLSRAEGEKFFQDKKVLLLSTSPGGYGGQNNLKNLKNIMPYWGAEVVGSYSLPKFYENMDMENNVIINAEERSKLKAALQQLELSSSVV